MLLLLDLSGSRVQAQQPPAGASPTPRIKVGNIRFWNMTPATGGITLDLVSGNTTEGRALINASPYNYFAVYTTVPTGSNVFKVFRAGDHQQPLKTFNLAVKDRGYYTLIATGGGNNGPVTFEFIDDTPDPTKSPSNRLTIRQFCQDMEVKVVATANFKTDALPFGKTATLEPMPDDLVNIHITGTKASITAVKSWELPADFRIARRYTVFVVNDLYGRMRARITPDGPSPTEEAAAAAEAKGNR